MSLQQVITFLNQYSITYIDPQTSIISINPNNINNNNNITNETNNQQNCYLLKDMLIPQSQQNTQQTQNNFHQILDTLKSHKALNNKYILTLLHYQVFMKNVNVQIPSTMVQDYSCKANLLSNSTSHIDNYPHNHLNKSNLNKNKHTQLYDTHSVIDSQQQQSQELSNQQIQQITTTTTVTQRAIRAIYEYTPLTLQQQIQNRISSHTNFEEEQLWAIMATITQALTYLQSCNIIYGVLGTDKIFITNSLVKILDPSATATDPLLVEEGRLYSPEILHRREDQEDIDLFKSDIYVVGLMMLECGLLIDLSREIEQDLSRYLEGFRTIYSQQLTNVVEQCLAHHPQDRPCFQQLQDYLTRQLDMNDFSHAYEDGHVEGNVDKGREGLLAMENDSQDIVNQEPIKIQVQNRKVQLSYDVLYERQDQLREIKIRGITAFDRAKCKFIREQDQEAEIQEGSDSSQQQKIVTQKRMPVRCGSPHNPLRAQSPKLQQTKRNIPKTVTESATSKLKSKSKEPYPSINSINAKISESVYGEELPTYPTALRQSQRNKDMHSRHEETKMNRNEVYLESRSKNSHHQSKQNLATDKNFQTKTQQKQANLKNMQKIKKTKLIKEKLIKNYQDLHHEHSFGHNNDKVLSENTHIINTNRIPQLHQRNQKDDNSKSTRKVQERQYFKYDHTGDSIQEELQEESESSCLYYNYNTNASKNWKFSRELSNDQHASISQSIKSGNEQQLSGNLSKAGSGKSSKVSLINQNQNQINKLNLPVLNRQREKNIFMTNNQHIFTDPSLMKTIKQDMQIFVKNRK